MGIYLTNIASMFATRNYKDASSALDTSYQRLASGKRINSAKDDPAGLQISNRLTSEIQGLTQGNRNAQDGLSLAQTAEGALDEVTNMLQRVRTLALQSANGTNSEADRAALDAEANQLFEEINRISQDTTFGGKKILDGSAGKIGIQVGAYANQTIDVDLGASFSVQGMAEKTGKQEVVDLFKDGFDLSTSESSQNVLGNIDSLITVVSGQRGMLGGVQSRLDSAIRYQSNSIVNLSDARSRIMDTDYATEASRMVSENIRMQASASILSQANQQKSIILSLIQSAFS